VALIPDDAFGKIAEAAFRQAVNRGGGTIVAIEFYRASANDMLEPMRRISTAIRAGKQQGSPIDALFVPGAQENLEVVGRLLPQAEIDTDEVKLIGTGGMDYPNAGRDPKLVGAWYPGPDPQGWNEFSEKYAKTYGQSPPRIASLAHDAVSIAVTLAAGGETARYTGEAITRASGFTGIDGAFRLLPDGTAERALAILEVKKFGAGVIDPAPALHSGPAAGVSGANASPGAGSTFFNFN
jgi:ABC-type branched-subunit amino acid transport system substrate-binding protein